MEAPENKLTERESLDVILNMIQTAKSELSDDSFYYLLWGWLVFIASLANYILLQLHQESAPLAWMLMPLGGVLTAVYAYRQGKKENKKTYMDEFMKYVLISFLVSMCLVIVFMSKLGLNTYPMIMMVYGMWLFVSGGAIKFKPIIIGGVINWAMAIVAFFLPFEQQLLCLAAAVLMGYIIPGHLLKAKFSSHV